MGYDELMEASKALAAAFTDLMIYTDNYPDEPSSIDQKIAKDAEKELAEALNRFGLAIIDRIIDV